MISNMKIKIPVGMAVIALLVITCAGSAVIAEERAIIASLSVIQAKDFSRLLGMKGFSDTLLNNHFKLYQGYVKNVNAVLAKLSALLAEKKDRTPEYAELKRRLGWEFNGVLLHEYYFENLGGGGSLDKKGALYKSIAENFGSFDAWKQDFISTASMRGIGWVVLYREPRTGKLVNAWINEHDTGHITAANPLVVLDVFEHAYLTDYQLDKEKYIQSFFQNLDWKIAEERAVFPDTSGKSSLLPK